MERDTLRKIIEDTFFLAYNVREGNDLEEQFESNRDNRIAELVISLGERLARAAGFGQHELWVPEDIEELVDVS